MAGGAGKTPTVLALVQALQRAGWRPGILSRGHGRAAAAIRFVAPGAGAQAVGDEPLLLWRRTRVPTVVGRDRVAAGQCLLRQHPEVDVLVCDDGLQHLRLARDAQVLVFDRRGTGNGWALPAGPLRAPMPKPRADTLVLYNAEQPSTPLPGHLALRRLAGAQRLADWLVAPAPSPQALAELALASREKPVWAAAGIAEPARFFDMLTAAGVQLTPLPLPDHHPFDTCPWPDGATVLLTEKDAVKLDPRARPRDQLWVVALDFQLPPALLEQLLSALASRRSPGSTP